MNHPPGLGGVIGRLGRVAQIWVFGWGTPSLQAAACALLLTFLLAPLAHAATWTVGVVELQDDARYANRRLERAYAGHPQGRAMDAARVALDESQSELDAAGHKLTLQPFVAAGATNADMTKLVAQLKAAKVQHVLLDLPDDALPAFLSAAREPLAGALLFNTSSALDSLRGEACQPNLLHTLPSQAMLMDALVQYLVARNWSQALALAGPRPADQVLLAAFNRSAKRFGLKAGKPVPFKLTGDPRERELSNVRLLTADRGHDVVVVLDSDGEFAQTVPYNTQWPRPVVGSAGLVAMAWHPQWARNGGPQLSRRFVRQAKRPMLAQDWAAWLAVKSVVAVLAEQPRATVPEQLRLLRSGEVGLDGFKGPRLSFRAWDGQLRQPVFLGSADGVAATAPLEGVMHPTEVLDTLGVDEKESACRKRP